MRIFERLAGLEREGEAVAIATVIRAQGSVPRHEGSKMLIFPGGGIEGTIGGGELEKRVIEEALQVLKDGKPRILEYAFRDPEQGDVGVCGGEMEVFVEALRPSSTLVVVGGGHVGKAVVHLASWLGFRIVVSDDRLEYVSSQAVPDADEYIHCELGQLPEKMKIHEETYLVLTTRGVDVDVDGLPKLLDTPAAYIGMGDDSERTYRKRCSKGEDRTRDLSNGIRDKRGNPRGDCGEYPGTDCHAAPGRDR